MQQNTAELKISQLAGSDGEVITTKPFKNSILTLPVEGFVSYKNMRPDPRVVVFLFEEPPEAAGCEIFVDPPKIKRISPFWCAK